MAHINKVLQSLETADGGRCVDIFLRPDHTFGFEEFRRDVEDNRGWYPIGCFSHRKFVSEKLTLEDALKAVPWLNDI